MSKDHSCHTDLIPVAVWNILQLEEEAPGIPDTLSFHKSLKLLDFTLLNSIVAHASTRQFPF